MSKKTLKEKNMKALKLIRDDGYENVHYASLGGQKFKTLVVADRKDKQDQWFEQPEIECVPEKVSDIRGEGDEDFSNQSYFV